MPHALRLSTAYFAFFAYLGSAGPYLTAYLKAQGLGEGASGSLVAFLTVGSLVGGWFIPRAADRLGNRWKLRRALSLAGAATCFLWLFVPPWPYSVLLIVIQGFCVGPQIPMMDAAAIDALDGRRELWGRLRLFGTLGWGVAAFSMGYARDGAPEMIPWFMGTCLLAFHISAWMLPDVQVRTPGTRTALDLKQAATNPALMVLLAACILHGVAFGHYEHWSARTFETLAGATSRQVGAILVIGIICEAFIFFINPWILRRFLSLHLIIVAIGLSAFRWFLMTKMTTVSALAFAQPLHVFSFAIWYSTALYIIANLVKPEVRTSGQALLFVAFAIGMTAGAVLSGHLRESIGVAESFYIAALIDTAAALLLIFSSRCFRSPTQVGAKASA